MHHLTKKRFGGKRFIEQLDLKVVEVLDELVPNFIGEPAFELAIGAMYFLWVRGKSESDLKILLWSDPREIDT